jgi:hypothetical protein
LRVWLRGQPQPPAVTAPDQHGWHFPKQKAMLHDASRLELAGPTCKIKQVQHLVREHSHRDVRFKFSDSLGFCMSAIMQCSKGIVLVVIEVKAYSEFLLGC